MKNTSPVHRKIMVNAYVDSALAAKDCFFYRVIVVWSDYKCEYLFFDLHPHYNLGAVEREIEKRICYPLLLANIRWWINCGYHNRQKFWNYSKSYFKRRRRGRVAFAIRGRDELSTMSPKTEVMIDVAYGANVINENKTTFTIDEEAGERTPLLGKKKTTIKKSGVHLDPAVLALFTFLVVGTMIGMYLLCHDG